MNMEAIFVVMNTTKAVEEIPGNYKAMEPSCYHTSNDQLPVGFLAQLVEHCASITDIMGSNPVQA